MMEGLSLMKCSSCRRSVSEPNTSTMIAVMSGIAGKCRVSAYETACASTAGATKMPTRSSGAMSAGRIGETSGRNSAGRELARKNSSNGPRSSTSLSTGLSCGFFAFIAAHLARPRRNCHRASRLAGEMFSFDSGDRPGEVPGREWREIVDTLPDADEVNRQAEFRGDGDQDAAARRAVELGHDKSANAGNVAKNLDLRECVLP